MPKELRVLLIGPRSEAAAGDLAPLAEFETAQSIEAAEEMLLTTEPPGMIFIDAGVGAGAIPRLRRIKQVSGDIPVVVIGGDQDPNFLREAVEAGAVGVVGKPPSPDQIRDAIEVVRAGGSYLDPARTKGMFEAIGISTSSKEPVVTNRELEVLRLLFDGLSARQIATNLGLSERTVNTHVANVYRKLGASNRVEAIRIAMRLGMLS